METIYYLTSALLALGLPALIIAIIVYLIKPSLLSRSKHITQSVSRGKIAIIGLTAVAVTILGSGIVMGATEPASVKQARITEQTQRQNAELAKQQAAEKARLEAAKPKVKVEIKTEVVPFESAEQNDSSIPLGERRIATDGVNGERTITYDVTYVKGKETTRTETKTEVTKAPVTKLTLVGTYVKPAPKPTPAPSYSSGDGYTNSRGNYVPSPSSSPAGASAQCADGTYSYSQSRRGTCSHHGGVSTWL